MATGFPSGQYSLETRLQVPFQNSNNNTFRGGQFNLKTFPIGQILDLYVQGDNDAKRKAGESLEDWHDYSSNHICFLLILGLYFLGDQDGSGGRGPGDRHCDQQDLGAPAQVGGTLRVSVMNSEVFMLKKKMHSEVFMLKKFILSNFR